MVKYLSPLPNTYLPSLPCQFCDSGSDLVETNLESRPPSLAVEPLTLQSRTLVEPLPHHISFDFVPRHQTSQHAQSPDDISTFVVVQLDAASIASIQPRVCLLRLWDLNGLGLGPKPGKGSVRWSIHHGIEVEPGRCVLAPHHEVLAEMFAGIVGALARAGPPYGKARGAS